MAPGIVLSRPICHRALRHGRRALQQLTRLPQQGFDTFESGDFVVRDSIQILLLLP